jgi:hypothetical protein
MSEIGLGQALKDYRKTVTDTDTVGDSRGVGGRGGRGGRGVKKRKAAAGAGKPRETRACSNKPPASPPTSPSCTYVMKRIWSVTMTRPMAMERYS